MYSPLQILLIGKWNYSQANDIEYDCILGFLMIFLKNRAMVNERKSQSILVSGESGAGKTETTKLLMQYIAYMGGRAMTDGRSVEQQVLEVMIL